MKVSEAMRKGAEMSEPMQTILAYRNEEGKLYACALGAIWLGNGGEPDPNEQDVYPKMRSLWPELNTPINDELIGGVATLETAIWERNDLFNWSREDIATWLEGLGY